MVGCSSSPELQQLRWAGSRKPSIQAEESIQAAAFVHTTEPFVEGRAETVSSLCPHCGAFKKVSVGIRAQGRG